MHDEHRHLIAGVHLGGAGAPGYVDCSVAAYAAPNEPCVRGTAVKAAICVRYGPPEALQVQEVARPVPRADELLVEIHASTVPFGGLLALHYLRKGGSPAVSGC